MCWSHGTASARTAAPRETQGVPYITSPLLARSGQASPPPATCAFANYVRDRWAMRFTVFGTDRVGARPPLPTCRRFEADRFRSPHAHIAALAAEGQMIFKDVARSIEQYKLDNDKPNPLVIRLA